jgi:hypothetical protein
MAKKKTAKFDHYEFRRGNVENIYFQKTKGDNRLPDELRTEPVRAEDKYKYFGVEEFLVSRQINKVQLFKTGLQKCATPNFYSGDILEAGVKSLVAVAFNDDKTLLHVFVFRGFYKHATNQRLNYVEDFLNQQQLKH